MMIKLVPGEGLVSVNRHFLIWTSEPTTQMLSQFESGTEDVFKVLAAAVIGADFEVPPFVAVDLLRNQAMVFGDAELRTSSGLHTGLSTSTWIETRVDLSAGLAVNGGSGADEWSNLVEGKVRAAGFVLTAEETAASSEAPDAVEGSNAEIGSSGQKSPTEHVPHEPKNQPELTELSSLKDDHEVPMDLFNEIPSDEIETDQFDEDITIVADFSTGTSTPSEPETMTYSGTPPELSPQSHSDSDGGFLPLRPPGIPQLKAPQIRADQFAPTIGPSALTVRFDDGQEADIDRGLYVGRYPTKNGVPYGYMTITIRSEHVSRIHWEIDLSGAQPSIRDLGSLDGLLLKTDGGEPVEVPPNGSAQIDGEVRVEFGDRWAEIQVN